MPKDDSRKNNSIAIAIIGLIGTIVTAVFGSPVFVEWIRSQQTTVPPTAIVTQLPPIETENPVIDTPEPSFSEKILIFREDFDNDNVSGFAYDGYWQVGKDKNNRILETTGPGKAIFGPSDFTNGVIEFRMQIQENTGDGIAVVNFRDNGETAYALSFTMNQLDLGYRESNGSIQTFSAETTRSLLFEKDAWYLINIEIRGSQIIVYVDNNRIMSASDQRLGKGGLNFTIDSGVQAAFDDIQIWELK